MTGDEIREAFLRFFEDRHHLRVLSSSLIPAGDPTLLLTSAGMVQFKPYFTRELSPPHPRLTSCQKCFRTTDIDEVGDRKHLTFFEMLGNFSVGDYFKHEAIAWAWEFVTQHLKLPPERLWASVYLDDDEAFGYWREVGVPEERIIRLGEEDNFWGPPGIEGPCGPCSEIHYDYGPEHSCDKPTCGTPACGCDRFVELWNLVFMQLYQHPDGRREPLPAPNIDTGLGLERAAAILQGKDSAYETDLFVPIVQRVEELSGKAYGTDHDTDYAIRVVAEHARSAAFLIADGVVPGNEGRGYILRRVIRRAIRFGRRLGLEEAFLSRVAEAVIERMAPQYRELAEHRQFILRALELEEERFAQVVRSGLDELDGYFSAVASIPRQQLEELDALITGKLSEQDTQENVAFRRRTESLISALEQHVQPRVSNAIHGSIGWQRGYDRAKDDARGSLLQLSSVSFSAQFLREGEELTWDPPIDKDELRQRYAELRSIVEQVPGALVFELYDTYGFPPELTREIAREHGLDVDMAGFEQEMEAQRERARAARVGGTRDALRAYEGLGVNATPFLGYEAVEAHTTVVAIIQDGQAVERATQGQQVEVVLQETPFYAEGGGQVGDTGIVQGPRGRLRIEDTQKPVGDLIVHSGYVEEGEVGVGDAVHAQVDAERRQESARNHTATHLLHAALREVLGTHVRQAGSLVAPDRLRFDFTHVSGLSREELFQVQYLVNEKVRQDVPVQKRETTFREATQKGALAFFGDRYGDRVRVVEINTAKPFSMEVCGGTHVAHTGQIGYLHILSEGSIGSGLRRIEAVTGRAAERLIWEHTGLLESLAQRLQTTPAELEQRAEALLREAEQARKVQAAVQRDASRTEAQQLLSQVQQVDGVSVLSVRASASSADGLRQMGDWLRDKLGSGVVVLGNVLNDRPTLVAMVTRDLVERGLHAGEIVRQAAQVMGGGGGGRAEVAQAGGKRPEKLDAALASVAELVRKRGGAS